MRRAQLILAALSPIQANPAQDFSFDSASTASANRLRLIALLQNFRYHQSIHAHIWSAAISKLGIATIKLQPLLQHPPSHIQIPPSLHSRPSRRRRAKHSHAHCTSRAQTNRMKAFAILLLVILKIYLLAGRASVGLGRSDDKPAATFRERLHAGVRQQQNHTDMMISPATEKGATETRRRSSVRGEKTRGGHVACIRIGQL